MECRECGADIDPETDRHLVVTERLVAPDWGVVGSGDRVLCRDCMPPQAETLAPA